MDNLICLVLGVITGFGIGLSLAVTHEQKGAGEQVCNGDNYAWVEGDLYCRTPEGALVLAKHNTTEVVCRGSL